MVQSASSVTGSESTLLSLPPELFQLVTLEVIGQCGLAESWKLRRVCKTFRRYIEDEVLTSVPIHTFNERDNTSNIIVDNIDQCLLKRCSSSQAMLVNALPYFIVHLVDRVLKDFPPANPDEILVDIRQTYIADVVKVLISDVYGRHLIMSGTGGALEWDIVRLMKSSAFDLGTSPLRDIDLMVAASATGNASAVEYFLEKGQESLLEEGLLLPDHFSKESFLSWMPLEAAVATGKLEVVKLLLDNFRRILSETPSWYSQDRLHQANSIHDDSGDKILLQLLDAIVGATEQSKVEELRCLLEFEFQYYTNSQSRYANLVSSVVDTGSVETLKVVCTFKSPEYDPLASGFPTYWLKDLLLSDRHEVIQCLLENDLISIRIQAPWYTGIHTPLHWVAEKGQGVVAKILISHGVDIDRHQGTHLAWTPTALKTAAYHGNLEVARSLLEAGANVYHGSPLTAVFNCQKRPGSADVYEMTRLLLDYGTPVNRRVVWDIEEDARDVVDPMRWWKRKRSPQLVMGIIAVAAALKEKLSRHHTSYADYRMRVNKVRDRKGSRGLQEHYHHGKNHSPRWPKLYFTRLLLQKVVKLGKGSLKKPIPQTHRQEMVAVACELLGWLEERKG